jgi:hypothetical protein
VWQFTCCETSNHNWISSHRCPDPRVRTYTCWPVIQISPRVLFPIDNVDILTLTPLPHQVKIQTSWILPAVNHQRIPRRPRVTTAIDHPICPYNPRMTSALALSLSPGERERISPADGVITHALHMLLRSLDAKHPVLQHPMPQLRRMPMFEPAKRQVHRHRGNANAIEERLLESDRRH